MDSMHAKWVAEEQEHRELIAAEEQEIERLQTERTHLQTTVAMERVAAEESWRAVEEEVRSMRATARADADATVQRAKLAAMKWNAPEKIRAEPRALKEAETMMTGAEDALALTGANGAIGHRTST